MGDICKYCDRIFYTALDFDVVDHQTGKRRGSDHTPHIATLKPKRPVEDYARCEVPPPITCCQTCGNRGFCSPVSNQCYGFKKKDYYLTCATNSDADPSPAPTPSPQPTTAPTCCSACGNRGFCSPVSNQCYEFKKKDYYLTCATSSDADLSPPPTPSPQPTTAPTCCSACGTQNFCSPVSNQCYGFKKKDYYLTCSAGSTADVSSPAPTPAPDSANATTCCTACGKGFCSPESN